MIDLDAFELVREKYGHYASWAVWAEEGSTPTSNMDDLSMFSHPKLDDVLGELKPNIVMVGLNISKRIESPLSNFHGKNGHAHKVRHTFLGSPFWGAYMTTDTLGTRKRLTCVKRWVWKGRKLLDAEKRSLIGPVERQP